MPPRLDVVVVGNAGLDTSVYLPGAGVDARVESNFTLNLDCVGQAGGYTARGLAQLGRRTAFIGYLGDDWAGQVVRQALARDKVDLTALLADPAGTARSVNLMNPDGTRRNFYDGKSHMQLEPPLPLCEAVLARAPLTLFHLPNWARRLLPIARRHGLTIACDLQDVVDPADPYRAEFIDHADILFCSAANHPDPAPLVQRLLEGNPDRIVIIGRGARGAVLGTRHGVRTFPPVDLPDLPVVDTNGAGDGLAVGFLDSYVLEKLPLEESLRRGQIVARYTCSLRADSDRLITRAQLEAFAGG